MKKPLLFLDIDGVLNILPEVVKTRKAPPEGFSVHYLWLGAEERPVLVNKEIGREIRSLSDDVEIVWASHWNTQSNRFGALLGLPRFEFVAVRPWAETKAPSIFYEIAYWNSPRPAIWVDDQCTADDVFQMQCRISSPFSALRTDPAVGLRLQDIDLIRSEIALLG